ncbi:MAG TPA: TIGR03885 family FMN-dependent LLM class oxidoreductase [Acidimicrobiales bacterium]|nr:TIGR03885 family FMN-dependent LLM class oxidoreductase [Acidimicrobiales bacterium]
MAVIGFHAAHEQLLPSQLLRAVQRAEDAGFGAAMCSDHLAPWSERQGESGNTWVWLGAALQATSLRFGTVTAPGQRYHPAVHAQQIATVAELFPGRFWAALGSGEQMNEHVTGDVWLPKPERVERLLECADVIRRLLDGEEVTHRGSITVDEAKVWSRPPTPPPLYAAAVSPESAATAATWADGLITVVQPMDVLREVLDEWGGRGPTLLQVHLSWAEDESEAEAIALDQCAAAALQDPLPWDLKTPAHFDAATAAVGVDDLRDAVRISSDLAQHAAWISELVEVGFDEVYLHHVGKEQDAFIDAFGSKVLPELAA